MKKLMLVFGTRPEAIKMCPLVKEFQKYPKQFETIVCVTGQHREMLDQVLTFFDDTVACEKMCKAVNPYGDGKTCYCIVRALNGETVKLYSIN